MKHEDERDLEIIKTEAQESVEEQQDERAAGQAAEDGHDALIEEPVGQGAENQAEQAAPKKSLGRNILEWILSIGAALLIVILIRSFLFTMIRVEGPSMEDTLLEKDRLVVTILDMKINGPQRFDVVITKFPEDVENGIRKRYVKRVIGMPGETIEIRDGQTYINGEALEEPYLDEGMTMRDFGPVKLGEDSYFVMGDNRNNSHDSRSADVGPISRSLFIGKARFTVWPFDRWGSVE